MPSHHLLRDGVDYAGDVELPRLACDLGVEEDLEEQVPQFLAQQTRVLAGYGLMISTRC
jgi:hypothetical protein